MALVLLTGAFGAVGRHTLDALVAAGHRVRAFDLDTPRTRKAARATPAEVRWGDLRDGDAVRAAVDGVDAIVHMGFVIHPDTEADPDRAREVNVGGTENILAAAEAQARPPKLVFCSSYHVHPHVRERTPPLSVDAPVAATDHYAAHKIACEAAVRASRLRWTILRLSSVMLDRAPDAKNLRILYGVPLDTRMEMVHPDDAALALTRAVDEPGCDGRVLFIGGGPSCQTTYRGLLEASFAARGLPMLPEAAFPTEPAFIGDWLDTAESERLLRFQRTGLAEWIARSQTAPPAVRWATGLVAPVVQWWMLGHSPHWGRP